MGRGDARSRWYHRPVSSLERRVDEIYARLGTLTESDDESRAVVEEAIGMLDDGSARVAEIDASGDVVVNEWLKRAILCFFRLRGITTETAGPFEYADRLPLKHGYEAAGVRVVPGGSARWGSYLAPGVILMPSYVNIGAHPRRHLGDGRELRADRRGRAPLGRCRHRRGA